jgi:hypothetical protein
MFKDFTSKFSVLCEEATTRFNQSGFLMGDYCVIRPDALKNDFFKGKATDFIAKVKEMMKSDKPLKISSIKSSRPESSNDLVAGAGNAYIGTFADVITCLSPALWTNPITLPTEVLDVVVPLENNWSPANPDSWKRKDDSQIKPVPVKDADGELEHQTQGSKRKLPTKDTKGITKGSAKDASTGLKKPAKK